MKKWQAVCKKEQWRVRAIEEDGFLIDVARKVRNEETARLISAAPDIQVAAEKVIKQWSSFAQVHPLKGLVEAIAKANGDSYREMANRANAEAKEKTLEALKAIQKRN